MDGTAFNGNGVSGFSTNGPGVHGETTNNNGVVGVTHSSSAAAITAVAPSASGLAYWGTGGLNLTGSLQIGSQNDANALTGNGSAYKPGGGSWSSTSSDARTKKDVKDFGQGLSELMRVRPVTYKYNGLGGTEDDGREFIGVIAQELEKVAPTMILNRHVKLHKEDPNETDLKTVDPSAFTYMLINAVKEQQKVIDRQEARLATLERNRKPLTSSLVPGLGALGIGLIPLAFVAHRRRREATLP